MSEEKTFDPETDTHPLPPEEEVSESHDEDVADVLKNDTKDGKGGAVVPKTDFKSYATDDVEVEDDKES